MKYEEEWECCEDEKTLEKGKMAGGKYQVAETPKLTEK